MGYRLGVDLGTTFTAAAIDDGRGGPVMLGLGNRALQVPSVLYLPPTGEVVVGEAAERRGVTDPSRVVREFKRRIGDSVPIRVAGVPYSPQALSAKLLRWVVDAATEQRGARPDRVVLTHPANWGPFKRELLAQMIQLADVGEVTLIAEPQAAAVQYATRAPVRPGERIAVYDLGGGTFDTCVLERTTGGFEMLGDPVGIEHLGGIDFDDAVFQHVLGALGDRLDGLDLEAEESRVAMARLRRDCVEAKEALSADVATAVPVTLPRLTTTVRLTRAELEDLIRPPLESTLAAVRRSLRTARLEPADLRSIVLVGGGSRIPLVRELLEAEFGVPTALDTHPKHDIALGAVGLLPVADAVAEPARGSVLGPAPKPVPVPVPGPVPGPMPGPGPVEAGPTELIETVEPEPEPVAVAVEAGARPPWTPETPLEKRRFAPGWAILAAAVAVVAVLGTVAGLLAHGGGEPDPSAAGPAASSATPVAATSPSPTPTPTASDTPTTAVAGLPVLPAAAKLPADQMLVAMRVAGNWDVYVAAVGRATPVRRLTRGPERDSLPVLSPDRRSVIFVRQVGDVRTLRVMGSDGRGQRALFDPVPRQCLGSAFRIGWDQHDSNQLSTACVDRIGRRWLYLWRTDGKILHRFDVDAGEVGDAAFSPDGRTVAFQARTGHADLDGGSIYVVSSDDSGIGRKLTSSPPGTDADPVWTPDGQSIVFRRRVADGTAGGNLELYIVPADATAPARPLVSDPADDQNPSFSPAGDRIAVISDRLHADGTGHGTDRLWVLDRDGTGAELVLGGAGAQELAAPSWSAR